MKDIFVELCKSVGEEKVKKNVSLAAYTTFKIGGNADYITEPENVQDIKAIIDICKENEIPYFVLGNGSNLLVSDKGYKGVIIHILSKMNKIKVDGDYIYAEAGALLIKVALMAKENGLTGLEFASGIPGTVGGAICMNAGAYGGEMKNVVTSVTVLDQEGHIKNIDVDGMNFGYRQSIVESQGLIVLSTCIKLCLGDKEKINAEMKKFALARTTKQPIEYPSAGSTFKRPEGYFAGKLIMDSGLKGASFGGAQVSEKHCGFVINKGGATADDVMKLIDLIQNKVMDQYGVSLEPEVKLLGEF